MKFYSVWSDKIYLPVIIPFPFYRGGLGWAKNLRHSRKIKCTPLFVFVFFFAFCKPRLKKQLSEMQSSSESAILQSIEKNSTRQQQAIQQVNVKFQMLYMISHVWNQLTAKPLWHNFVLISKIPKPSRCQRMNCI